MNGQRTNPESGDNVKLGAAVKKQLVVMLSYGLAAMLFLANLLHRSRSEDYEGLALMPLGFVLIPLWVFSGTIALKGAVRTAFWLTVAPIILAVILVVVATLSR